MSLSSSALAEVPANKVAKTRGEERSMVFSFKIFISFLCSKSLGETTMSIGKNYDINMKVVKKSEILIKMLFEV